MKLTEDMKMSVSRREARKEIVGLIFETEFKADESVEEILSLAISDRELPDDEYIKKVYLGICEKREEIDAIINNHAHGWKTQRMTRVSLSVLRLCIYEMVYEKIPCAVAINEAVELAKLFDDDKAKGFINGILNSVKEELEGGNVK